MSHCLWRPDIAAALEYVRDRAIPVSLTYDGRPREAGPLLCLVTFTARDITVLSMAETPLARAMVIRITPMVPATPKDVPSA